MAKLVFPCADAKDARLMMAPKVSLQKAEMLPQVAKVYYCFKWFALNMKEERGAKSYQIPAELTELQNFDWV